MQVSHFCTLAQIFLSFSHQIKQTNKKLNRCIHCHYSSMYLISTHQSTSISFYPPLTRVLSGAVHTNWRTSLPSPYRNQALQNILCHFLRLFTSSPLRPPWCPSSQHQEGECASVCVVARLTPSPPKVRAGRVTAEVKDLVATLKVPENCTKELYFAMIGSGCARVWPPAVSVAWEELGRCGGVLRVWSGGCGAGLWVSCLLCWECPRVYHHYHFISWVNRLRTK